jgi:hypothetical protein
LLLLASLPHLVHLIIVSFPNDEDLNSVASGCVNDPIFTDIDSPLTIFCSDKLLAVMRLRIPQQSEDCRSNLLALLACNAAELCLQR